MKGESGKLFGPEGPVPVERECEAGGPQEHLAHLSEVEVQPLFVEAQEARAVLAEPVAVEVLEAAGKARLGSLEAH